MTAGQTLPETKRIRAITSDRLTMVTANSAADRTGRELEAYTPDSWEALEPMPTPRHGTGAAELDGVIYVPGGATMQAFGAVDTHEAYVP